MLNELQILTSYLLWTILIVNWKGSKHIRISERFTLFCGHFHRSSCLSYIQVCQVTICQNLPIKIWTIGCNIMSVWLGSCFLKLCRFGKTHDLLVNILLDSNTVRLIHRFWFIILSKILAQKIGWMFVKFHAVICQLDLVEFQIGCLLHTLIAKVWLLSLTEA